MHLNNKNNVNSFTEIHSANINNQSRLPVVVSAFIFALSLSCFSVSEPISADASNVSVNASANSNAKAIKPIDSQRAINANAEPENWLLHGRTYDEQRFSPLTQINTESIDDLSLAWHFETGTVRGLEASPIIVDGRMYTTGPWGVVFALDAKTGEQLWFFDPQVDKSRGYYACCDTVNRGAAVWDDKVYVGTLDGRLVAIDALTGQSVWQTQTFDLDKAYTITGAPRIVDGKVIIGNGGADFGVRGYVTAYDAKNGEQLWRFYTVPGNPEDGFESKELAVAAETWNGEWWELGGGGTVWDSMAYDAELNQLYIGVGNGSPWNSYVRSPEGGDNLYLSSIVALNPDNGEYIWHYQTTPGERWDYTATQHMILAELPIEGEQRQVIMQAPKNGFFYVIDRTNGKLISAEPYARVNWASHIDLETGRPVFTDVADYRDEPKFTLPSMVGAHNWHPMAYHPEHKLVYIPVIEQGFEFKANDEFANEGTLHTGVVMSMGRADPLLMRAVQRATHIGSIVAWDPIKQAERWRVDFNRAWSMSMLTTAGNLLFQGTHDGWLKAYRADTGEQVWQGQTQIGTMAPPVTYSVDGEQYIAVMSGWGGFMGMMGGGNIEYTESKGRVLAFKLGGTASLPPTIPRPVMPEPAEITVTEAELDEGQQLYATHCGRCHGPAVQSGGLVPDLRYMSAETHRIFDAIVIGGIYADRGMVSFAEDLSIEQSHLVHQYIISEMHAHKAMEASPDWWNKLKLWVYEKVVRLSS